MAEITSATILSTLGIETKGSFENAVAYINNWMQALRNDKRMIVTAASKAEKAVTLIMGGKRPRVERRKSNERSRIYKGVTAKK